MKVIGSHASAASEPVFCRGTHKVYFPQCVAGTLTLRDWYTKIHINVMEKLEVIAHATREGFSMILCLLLCVLNSLRC